MTMLTEHSISVMRELNKIFCLLLLFLLLQKTVLATNCVNETFTEVRTEWEYSFANISYRYNITEGSVYSDKFDLLFEVCEGQETTLHCTFFWRKQSKNPIVFRTLISGNETICFARQIDDISTSVTTYEIQISQLVRRPLTFFKLSITDENNKADVLRLICVEVLYPPRITSLTVDDHEVNGDYLIQKDQEVIVTCLFDKGNPPVPVRLLNKHEKHLSSSKDSGQVSISVVVRCEDEWPMVLCKSDDSEYKRFVSFLVRCPPQFLEKSTKIIRPSSLENITFLVKTHTAIVDECLLTSQFLKEDETRKVNCTLSGNTPNLHLHLHLTNITQGSWILTLRNEVGSANTSLFIADVSSK
ncbi:uncharacterized protein LOC112569432 [Pomacea canaliculata]|uniref:uncharacterized protein LOC112569432 n=1 Tax=Pomacea canaliculata TaxID=400727 RepID=UPI000D727CC3|nr:uncharacterized protein LOC112569432 [Pomacea canaliculata]